MTREQKEALVVEIRQRYDLVSPYLSERTRRIWAAAEATVIGRGGISLVCEATGISRVTLTKGQQELRNDGPEAIDRIRQRGGGRKKLSEHDPQLLEDLDRLIDPYTRGAPESPLRWTCKSTYKLSKALKEATVETDPGGQWVFNVDPLSTHKSAGLVEWVANSATWKGSWA